MFSSLDTDGDGSLDYDEFREITWRLTIKGDNGEVINLSEEQLKNAFRMADVDESGTLEVNEFQMAYDILYFGAIMDSARASSGETFVRATRYGYDRVENKYVFSMYTGTLFTLIDYYDFNEPDVMMPLPCSGDLRDIYKMLLEDGKANHEHGSKILWWIDVATENMSPGVVSTLVHRLGLPNDIESNLTGASSGTDRNSRLRVGTGVSSYGLEVESLNLFMETMHVSNTPVIDERLSFLRGLENWASHQSVTSQLGALVSSGVSYLTERLAQCISYAEAPNMERLTALHRAQAQAENMVEMDGELDQELLKKKALLPEDHLQLPEIGITRPRFLLSYSDMKMRPPSVEKNRLSLHLLNQGFGVNALLSVRLMDAETDVNPSGKPWLLKSRSRAGLLGRLLRGVWRKLMVVVLMGGVTRSFSNLGDHSSTLFHFIILQINSYNIDAVSATELWLDEVEKNMSTVLKQKHLQHLQSISDSARSIREYLAPMKWIFDTLLRQEKSVPSVVPISVPAVGQKKEMDAQVPPPPPVLAVLEQSHDQEMKQDGGQDSIHLGDVRDSGSSGSNAPLSRIKESDDDIRRAIDNGERDIPTTPDVRLSSGFHAGLRKNQTGEDASFRPPPDSTEYVLSWEVLKGYLGPRRDGILEVMLGNNQCEIKGLEYFCRRYDGLMDHLDRVEKKLTTKLAEKRNFWLSLLTLLLFATFPLMFFTTYWSMNFDNMTEFEVVKDRSMTGVGVVWYTWLIVYSLALVLVVHFKLFEFFG